MRLDPVYLVEPRPGHPTMSTRRAFLLAGSTFAIGTSLGGACGFAAGVASTRSDPESPGNHDNLEPSGDSLLDELRRLAVKAPIEELVQKRLDFVNLLYTTYPGDATAWQGIGRLAKHYIENAQAPDRHVFARWIAQVIERSPEDISKHYTDYIIPLRRTK